MRLLSFDTSASDLHACLAENQNIVAKTIVQSNVADRQYAASHLIPTIQSLLDEAGWAKSELDCVVVGVGPGSFTGTRVALVTARTIAQALALPLIDVSIFESFAFAARTQGRLTAAIILSAGREHFFWSAFEHDEQLNNHYLFKPTYTDLETMVTSLKAVPLWLTDVKSHELLSKSYTSQLEKLPNLENIAVTQCQIAWLKLSLYGLNFPDADKSKDESHKDRLLSKFPYGQVVPLYLQNASITLKSKV